MGSMTCWNAKDNKKPVQYHFEPASSKLMGWRMDQSSLMILWVCVPSMVFKCTEIHSGFQATKINFYCMYTLTFDFGNYFFYSYP
jgi:hypothetical protein